MLRLIEIYNLNCGEDDVAFINIDHISSIKRMEYGNAYMIVMSNSVMYRTDKESFEKIMSVAGRRLV